MPKPILLVNLLATSISATGYLFESITLSRNLVVSLIACSYLCQSNSNSPSALRFTRFAKLIDPKLQDSYGYRLCSPQGLVALMNPCTLLITLYLFMLSKNKTPGSALCHALNAIRSTNWFASICFTICPLLGFFNGYLLLLFIASQKSSQIPTLTLKFSKTPGFVFAVTNFSISGCHASIMPILAPLLFPPCFTTSVTVSMILMNDVGPDATPEVDATMS